MSLTARLSVLALVWLGFVSPAAAATCTLSVVASLPLTVSGSRLYVPITMNATDGLFMVDTGSQDTLLTADYAARSHVGMDTHAGRKIYSGAGGRQTLPVNMAHVRRIEMAKLAFQDWEFAVIPAEAGGLGKTQHDGILGMDFMHYFDIDVELDTHRLIFWRLQDCRDIHPEWSGDYDSIPLTRMPSHGETIPILLDNAILDVQFDTGADGLLLTRAAGAKAGVTDDMLNHDHDPHGAGVGGSFPSVVHQFGLLMVGKSEFHQPKVVVETETHRTSYDDGLIDWRYLKARKFWISNSTGTLFVQAAGK
jgi:hypothetical protein